MVFLRVLLLPVILVLFVALRSASQVTIETDPKNAVVCTGQNITISCHGSSQQATPCIPQDETKCIDFSGNVTLVVSFKSTFKYAYSNVSKKANNLPIKCHVSNDGSIEPSNTVILKVVDSVPQVTDISVIINYTSVNIDWSPPIIESSDIDKYILKIPQVLNMNSNMDIENPPVSFKLDHFEDGKVYNVSVSPVLLVCQKMQNFTSKEFEFKVPIKGVSNNHSNMNNSGNGDDSTSDDEKGSGHSDMSSSSNNTSSGDDSNVDNNEEEKTDITMIDRIISAVTGASAGVALGAAILVIAIIIGIYYFVSKYYKKNYKISKGE